MPSGWQSALFIVGTIVIIIAAYYATSFLGMAARRSKTGRSIILRDRFAISKDKSFCLVELCGKVYLVGMTNQSMTLIDKLDAEALAAETLAAEEKTGNRPYSPAGIQKTLTEGFASLLAGKLRRDATSGGDERYAENGSAPEAASEADRPDVESGNQKSRRAGLALPTDPEEKE